jgi:surface antigen
MRLKYLFLLSLVMLGGCSTVQRPDDTVTGSVVSAPVKPSVASTFIGDSAVPMDDYARGDYLVAQNSALETGEPTTFSNMTMGAQGYVSVGPSAFSAVNPSMDCKRYSSVVWVLGKGRLVEGDACREAGGEWKPMGYVAH